MSSRRSGAIVTLTVSGEVDVFTGPLVTDAINEALAAEGVRAVVVDLAPVRFLDSSGIALLLKGRRNADERGVGYRVVGAHGIARQVLEMTGVWAHLSGDAGDGRRTPS